MITETSTFRAGLGIDGARAGWVVASEGDGRPALRLVPALDSIVDEIAERGALVDIPIGLPGGEHSTRACDQRARGLLGPRRSSVFPAPSRAALVASDWVEANDVNRHSTGRGLPRQSWGLVPKIRDVDRLLGRHRNLRGRIRESHPELAFAWLNGGAPMEHPKKDPTGLARRWEVLGDVWPGVEAHSIEWASDHPGVSPDDVADALALLTLASSGARPLPIEPDLDEAGLPMEILVHPSLTPE